MSTCDVITDRFSKRPVTANHTTPGGMSWDLLNNAVKNVNVLINLFLEMMTNPAHWNAMKNNVPYILIQVMCILVWAFPNVCYSNIQCYIIRTLIGIDFFWLSPCMTLTSPNILSVQMSPLGRWAAWYWRTMWRPTTRTFRQLWQSSSNRNVSPTSGTHHLSSVLPLVGFLFYNLDNHVTDWKIWWSVSQSYRPETLHVTINHL